MRFLICPRASIEISVSFLGNYHDQPNKRGGGQTLNGPPLPERGSAATPSSIWTYGHHDQTQGLGPHSDFATATTPERRCCIPPSPTRTRATVSLVVEPGVTWLFKNARGANVVSVSPDPTPREQTEGRARTR